MHQYPMKVDSSKNPSLILPKPKWYKTREAVVAHIAIVSCLTYFYAYHLFKSKKEELLVKLRKESQDTNAVTQVQQVNVQSTRPMPSHSSLPTNIHSNNHSNVHTFDQLAPFYDAKIENDEFLMGLNLVRRWLLSHANGTVLEASCGTGRNLKYYPTNLKSITLMDTSKEMLNQTIKKFESLVDERFIYKNTLWDKLLNFFSFRKIENKTNGTVGEEVPTEFVHANAGDLSFIQNAQYDTVIDTFGLCSIGPSLGSDVSNFPNQESNMKLENTHPSIALNEYVRICKPNGRILLLEHGESTWRIWNDILNSTSLKHFEDWGCWHNRDVKKLIDEVANREDIEVEYLGRWYFGTIVVAVLKKK